MASDDWLRVQFLPDAFCIRIAKNGCNIFPPFRRIAVAGKAFFERIRRLLGACPSPLQLKTHDEVFFVLNDLGIPTAWAALSNGTER